MRFVHSLWTSPSLNGRWNFDAKTATLANIWYNTLSAAYIKKLGQEIVLYTDSFGKECLDHIPYDEIYLTLEEKIPSDMCPIMWACSKFYALDNEQLGSIHIDGDVFIKNQKCLDIINEKEFDLFVQGEEDIVFLSDKQTQEIYEDNNTWLLHLQYPEGCTQHGTNAYNTGVLSFNNQELKDKFIKSYFFMLNQVINDKTLTDKWEKYRDICPDLVIEQRFLYDIAKGYNVRCLIDYYRKQVHEDACSIGFQHVLSKKKYKVLDKCMATLKKLDVDLYNKTLEKHKEIEKKYFTDDDGNNMRLY